jgi:hypothetical protein
MRKKHFCHRPKKYSRYHGKIGVCRDPGIRLTIFAVSQDFCLQFASWPSVKKVFCREPDFWLMAKTRVHGKLEVSGSDDLTNNFFINIFFVTPGFFLDPFP